MAEKKTPAQLKAEGATLSEAVALARKREMNFALSVGKEGLVLEVHPTKAPDVLWRAAKANGGGPKGAMGVMTATGKQVEFRCLADDVPGTLMKLCKRHFADRGVPLKFTFLTPAGPLGGDEEDGAETEGAEGAPDAAEDTGAAPAPPDPAPQAAAELSAGAHPAAAAATAADPRTEGDPAQLALGLVQAFAALVARVEGREEVGPVKKFRQMQKMFEGDLADGNLKRAGAILSLAGKLVEGLPEILHSLPPEAEAKRAEISEISNAVRAPGSPLEPESRDWLAGELDSYNALMLAGDVEAAETLLDTLHAKALALGPPLPTLDPRTASEIAAIEPGLLDSCLAPEAFLTWDDAAIGAVTEALQQACTELAPESDLFRTLEANLAAAETEQLRRWEAEDALLTTSLSPEDLAALGDGQVAETVANLRLMEGPAATAAQGNIDLLLQEQSKRASVDAADDVLFAAQKIDAAQALSSEIKPQLDQLRLVIDLPDLPPEMQAQMQAELTRLDGILADRTARAEKVLESVKTAPTTPIDTDTPEVRQLLDLLPGGDTIDFLADFEEAKAGFSVGVAAGYVGEAPASGIDHPPVTDWGGFYVAYNIGLLKGLWIGLTGLVDAVVMVAGVAAKVAPFVANPLKLVWEAAKFGVGEVADFVSDSDAYVAKRKAQVENVMKVVRALQAFQAEFDVNSFGMGSQVGTVVGKALAGYEKDFAGMTDAAKGELIGKVVGAIAFEIIIEAILAVATEGIGNVARAGLLTAQATKGSARFAGMLEGVVRNVPAIKRFLKAMGVVEDVADAADDASDLKKLAKLVEDLKNKRKAELPDGSGGKPKPDGTPDTTPDPDKPTADPDAPKPDEGGGSGKDGDGGGGDGGGGDGGGGEGGGDPPKPDPKKLADDIAAMPADKDSVVAIRKALDESGDVTEVARAAAAKLDEIGKRVDDLPGTGSNGRKPPTTEPDKTTWDTQTKALREAKAEVESLRIEVKKRLANTDGMTPEAIEELTRMKEKLDDNLLKLFDIEPSHGPVNHVNVTDDALLDRAGRGKNPRYGGDTGSNGTRATRIKDKETFLDAAELAHFDPAVPDKMLPETKAAFEAMPEGEDFFSAEVDMEKLFGPDYLDKVDGMVKGGPQSGSGAASPMTRADFEGQKATIHYALVDSQMVNGKRVGGHWEIASIFPNYRPGTTRPSLAEAKKVFDPNTGKWNNNP